MTYQIPTTEPDEITAGDTITWKKTLSDYPASTWTLSYALVMASALITITASADGDDHLVEEAPATSAAYAPGVYSWQAYVTDGTDRYLVGDGTLKVNVNYATQSSGYDARSHAKKTLDALEATILGKASKDQLSYSIAGRSISRMSPDELVTWRNHYRAEYNTEQRKISGKSNQLKVKFG